MAKESTKSKATNLEYEEPSFKINPENRIGELTDFIKTTDSVPAWVPRRFEEQFAIYTSGSTYRFYWYDTTNGAWRYATGT